METKIKNKKLWTIHGKKYDLAPFIKYHPGGKQILERATEMQDAGVMFEVYHAFSDKVAIRAKLEEFIIPQEKLYQYYDPYLEKPKENICTNNLKNKKIDTPKDIIDNSNNIINEKIKIGGCPFSLNKKDSDETIDTKITNDSETELELSQRTDEHNKEIDNKKDDKFQFFNDNIIAKVPKYDFSDYEELVAIIKKIFPNRESIKATNLWYIKNFLLFSSWIICNYLYAYSGYSTIFRSIVGFICGVFFISNGFNIMHDGAHYAISKYPRVNEFLERSWNALGLWNSFIWSVHHTYAHHSYTGDENLDPDLHHYRPFAYKVASDESRVLTLTKKYQHKLIVIIGCLFPGMYTGQSLAYLESCFTKNLMGIVLPKEIRIMKYITYYELFLSIFTFYTYYNAGLIPTIAYVTSCNIFYHINVAPDHDTFETLVENKEAGATKNWLKMQIANSGNFNCNNPLWTHIFGGINFQIEHHCFPNMSHMHYELIQPIVKEFCKKKGYPYNEHPSLTSAYMSFLRMMKHRVESIE